MNAVTTHNKAAGLRGRAQDRDPPFEQRKIGNRLYFEMSFGIGFQLQDSLEARCARTDPGKMDRAAGFSFVDVGLSDATDF